MKGAGERWRLGRRPELDAIRGIAILLVLVCHSAPGELASAGSLGVTMFFTLSGFLISTLLLDELEATNRIDFARFFRNRALRLVPALMAMLLAWTVFLKALGASLSTLLWWVIPSALYLQNWTTMFTGMYGPLGHTWSLAIEEQFYLLWPVLLAMLWAARRQSWLPWVAGALSAYAVLARALLWDHGEGKFRVYMGFDLHLDALLVGCLVAWILRRRCDGEARPAVIVAVLVVLVPLSLLGDEFGRYVVATTAAPLLTAVIIVCCAQGAGVPWMRWQPLVKLGQVSYGLYLWHFPLLTFLGPRLEAAIGWSAIPIRLAMAAVLTWSSWRWVERPFLDLKKGRGRRPAEESVAPATRIA